MLILVPWKPVVIIWLVMSGMLLFGYIAQSLLEGKNPFSIEKYHLERIYAQHSGVHNGSRQRHGEAANRHLHQNRSSARKTSPDGAPRQQTLQPCFGNDHLSQDHPRYSKVDAAS